jgi:integrase
VSRCRFCIRNNSFSVHVIPYVFFFGLTRKHLQSVVRPKCFVSQVTPAVSLTWEEVHFETKEIERVTQKRRKKVLLPIHKELLFALESDHERRRPQPTDRVLLNPSTRRPLSRPRLYQRVVAFGKRAGVANAHPHRFRDTLAVDMLSRGASPYDVAKMLGDTIETVEKHYTPFVKELRERVRSILETDSGLESTVTPVSQSQTPIQ